MKHEHNHEHSGFQEKYVEFQILSSQLKQLQQQFVNIEQQIMELKNLSVSLDKLSEIKESNDSLIPIGAGIFLEGTIKNKREAILTVGANVAVKKTMEETKDLLKKQIEEMEKIIIETENQMEAISGHLVELKSDLEKK